MHTQFRRGLIAALGVAALMAAAAPARADWHDHGDGWRWRQWHHWNGPWAYVPPPRVYYAPPPAYYAPPPPPPPVYYGYGY